MLRDLGDRLLGPARSPESFLPYRVAVAVTVQIAVVATIAQQAVTGAVGFLAALLIPVGFVVSYRRRHERNILLKVALAFGLFAAFGGFLGGVQGSVSIDDTRMPLTALFLWVQVLHSFDVPRRRDLGFSIAASIALIALAGSLSFSGGFLVFMLPYAVALVATFVLGHLAELREGAGVALATDSASAAPGPTRTRTPRGILRPAAALTAATLLCTSVVFVALPRLPGTRVAALPFEIARHTPISGFAGEVVNPGRRGGTGGTGTTGFAPDAYFGYGEELDLRTRGQLSHELVLRVRSPEPHLWRGQVFDVYDGRRWTSSDHDFDTIRQGFDQSIRVPRPPEEEAGPTREVIQTFFVERPLPNLVFHAHRAEEVYAPATSLLVDDFTSMRLDFILEQDTIYSVVSRVPDVSRDDLRFAPPPDTNDPALARYLQVPDTLSDRFHELALSITGGHDSTAGKAQAVEDWLERTKEYRLDIPPDPPGRDPVEVFVFDRDEGFCEQIASTMVLMLRASGVPARLVAGFGPGDRNLFTGYWEVRNSDAHAWVEVFYPGIGWIPYDPTFGVPASDSASTTFMFAPLARITGQLLPTEALRSLAEASGRLAGPAGVLAIGLLLLVAASTLVVRRPRRRRAPSTPLERVVGAWFAVEDALARRGCPRRPHETVRAFAARARGQPGMDHASLQSLVDTFSRFRYGARTPTADQARACEEQAARIVEALDSEKVPAFSARRA